MPVGTTAEFFLGAANFFDRTLNGFRCQTTDLYVRETIGHNIDEVFKLSVNDNGELAYIPIVMLPGRSDLRSYSLTLIYENGEEETINLPRRGTQRQTFREQPSLTRRNGIPIVSIMRMGFYPNGEDARQFLAYAEELREEPVVIIDIRSNMGGNNLLAAQFLHRLTGEIVPTNSVILNLGNHQQLMDALADMPSDSPIYRPLDDFQTYHPTIPFDDGHHIFNYTPDRLVPNEQLIVFLIDRYSPVWSCSIKRCKAIFDINRYRAHLANGFI
jgi:hypothetical protein